MKAKFRERTEQQKNGELGLIIDEFGRAMWNADREYIATHGYTPGKLTFNMWQAWRRYVEFCRGNPK